MDSTAIATIVAALIAAVSAIAVAIIRARSTKTEEKQSSPMEEKETMNRSLEPSPYKPVVPQDLMLKITVPAGFDVLGSNRISGLSKWLSNPLRAGDNPGSFEYPIEGQVLPNILGLVVKISIHTNQWWDQGRCWVQADGNFSGTVFLDKRLPSAVFRFDILNDNGDLLKRFDVNVS